MNLRSLLIAVAATVVALAPAAAQRRDRPVTVTPYIEVDQTVYGDLKNGGDVLTYTTLAVGSDARIQSRRVELQLNYRYEYRIGWGRQTDADIHSGLARGRFALVPDLLNLEAGALASRTRADIRGEAFNPLIGNPANTADLYSVYGGPAIAAQVGALNVGASYRIGYTKAESNGFSALPGQPVLDVFDNATSHALAASIGMRTGVLPFGWVLSGGYDREDASQLEQRYEGYYGRGDVTLPLTDTVALVGGAGYERIEASQRDPLLDAGGIPILDAAGRFQVDPAGPRRLTYATEGFIWDAGVLWRPNPRASAELRIGERYGSTTYVGNASYAMGDSVAFQANVYDGIQTFGRQVGGALASLPTQFTVARNPFGNPVSGCVFGANGSQGACLDPALQSIATGTYRARGVNAVLSYNRARWQAGLGLGYAKRRFFAPFNAGTFSVDGVTDESIYAQAYLGRQLSENSGADVSVYANWYSSGVAGAADVLGTGATAAYFRNFGPRFTARAALGLYSTRIDGVDSSLTGAAQLGARYSF